MSGMTVSPLHWRHRMMISRSLTETSVRALPQQVQCQRGPSRFKAPSIIVASSSSGPADQRRTRSANTVTEVSVTAACRLHLLSHMPTGARKRPFFAFGMSRIRPGPSSRHLGYALRVLGPIAQERLAILGQLSIRTQNSPSAEFPRQALRRLYLPEFDLTGPTIQPVAR